MMNKLWSNTRCHITYLCLHVRRLSAQQIRLSFLEYFKEHDHTYVPSSSVIPEDDNSVTFVNAGMNQFKPLFLGAKFTEGKFAALRNVVNWQKCIRVGGKHNDFDDVGRDLTHHTFFEMLGNYSFGGYSKAEACRYAWNFLTDVLRIPADRLYVTYFSGDENLKLKEDHECRDIWIKLGVPEDRVLGCCFNHNFWEMAETGPCGPCTEIHYDLIGNRKAQKLVNSNNPTVVEIWNLVFMQFTRDMSGRISSLPTLYVDCGMGFERLVSIVQGLRSAYDTDLFLPLMEIICKYSKVGRYSGRSGDIDTAYRIIADHLRAACIMISDGVEPGSRNRGYHLRRVLRRAALNLTLTLGAERGTLASLVPDFVNHITLLYDSVAACETIIVKTVMSEEQLFWKSYDKGTKLLEHNIASQQHILPGEIAWMLSGNYGLPLAIIQKVCNEKGLKVDVDGFHHCLTNFQKTQKAEEEPWQKVDLEKMMLSGVKATDDSEKYCCKRIKLGEYEFPSRTGAVVAIFDVNGKSVMALKSGEGGSVVMDSTVFFAEQGGQLYDRGILRDSLNNVIFTVNSAKRRNGYIIHTGEVANGQTLEKGLNLVQIIDPKQRFSLMCGHTATHILHFALEKVFDASVRQMGSFIGPDKLHFDFFVPDEKFTLEKIEEVMATVNMIIESNLNVTVKYILQNELGSMHKNFSAFDISQEAAFDGSYRIITIESSQLLGQDIIEPCCGTHVCNTGDIGRFVIIGQKSRSANVRRIYAVTNTTALESIHNATKLNNELSHALSDFSETFIDTHKFMKEFQKNLPLPSKSTIYEMLKTVKKRNKYLSRKTRSSDAN
ncbi:alanyl-tRNA synthetase [Loa loa]|nr:alanyl-tRNA synthetase [Loa loa]EFO19940.2 alanyl-tRNA synthetase [Loa loa]